MDRDLGLLLHKNGYSDHIFRFNSVLSTAFPFGSRPIVKCNERRNVSIIFAEQYCKPTDTYEQLRGSIIYLLRNFYFLISICVLSNFKSHTRILKLSKQNDKQNIFNFNKFLLF